MKFSHKVLSILCIALSFITYLIVLQAGIIDQSSDLLKFQRKRADKGSSEAQYKLAAMYETGIATEVDLEQAKHWYELSAASGNSDAKQRVMYLEIKKRGFDKTRDAGWLKLIISESKKNQPRSSYLLAQLYRYGIGVDKDLEKALVLANGISVFDVPYIDREIEEIEYEKGLIKKATKLTKAEPTKAKSEIVISKKAKQESQKDESAEVTDHSTEQAIKAAKLKAQRIEAKRSKAEKRRRYEAVMQQLKLEQEQINKQQQEIAGGASGEVNDEL